MKQLTLIILISTFSLSGFFNETSARDKAEFIENDRLCKLFQRKIVDYKKHMRDDFLAATTLASYEYRASLFCKKAASIKKELSSDVLEELNITVDKNITTIKK